MTPVGSESGAPRSKPERDAYPYKKRFYRDPVVAAHYDEERFAGRARARRNRRKWRTIARALEWIEARAGADATARVVDLPCGTGRFTGHLARRGSGVVGCDISLPMMREARDALGRPSGILGWVQAEAERLPLADGAADCVVCIRFMLHVPREVRVEILREMGRVARWLAVDYRHRYSYRWLKWRAARALGLTDRSLDRVSRRGLEAELADAGLALRRVFPVALFFSDKWIVVAERDGTRRGSGE
jgi:SAM-dependent methyltransferase